jgi:glyoxylase-like metal-dependent hydrolase (beta-lactamase superfamily II)
MELVPDLYWIEGRRSNIFLWQGEAGLILVDTGTPGDANNILKALHALGHQPSDLTAIFITHADWDHAGSTTVIQAQSGATVYAGPQTAEHLRVGKSPKHMSWPVQFMLDHFIRYRPVPAESIQVIEDGEAIPEFDSWVAMATPGHTLDHFSLWGLLHGVLFAGDALNTRGDELKSTPDRITADREAARQSAVRLLQLTPAVLACGHGRPKQGHDANELMALFRKLEEQTT